MTENGMIHGKPAELLPEDLHCTETACDPRLANQISAEKCVGCGRMVCKECQHDAYVTPAAGMRRELKHYYCGTCFGNMQEELDREERESQPEDSRNGGAR